MFSHTNKLIAVHTARRYSVAADIKACSHPKHARPDGPGDAFVPVQMPPDAEKQHQEHQE